MRVTPPTKAAHRAAILRQAGTLFRRDGIAAVGVAEITRAAGLTHGAFYGHFPSKTALAAEACCNSLERAAAHWRRRAEQALRDGRDPLACLIDTYLSPASRDTPETACALPALGSEASRDPDLRPAMTQGVAALAEVLTELLAARHPEWDAAQTTQAALAVLAALSGGLMLARTLAADPVKSDAALEAAATMAKCVAK